MAAIDSVVSAPLLAWYLVVLFCLGMYVLLDGFDLGIGVLSLGERDDGRRELCELVATAWDGNETWIVLMAVALWGGLPGASATLQPALYVPLVLMLFCLIFRGVSIEFQSQRDGYSRTWSQAFALGSLGAAFLQGMVLGGLIQGVIVDGVRFAGGAVDFLTPYSTLTGLAAVALYCAAGAAWASYKTEGELQMRMARRGRRAVLALAGLALASVVLLPVASDADLSFGPIGRAVVLVWCATVLACALAVTWRAFSSRLGGLAFLTMSLATIAGLAGLVAAFYPVIVPPHVTLTLAASPGDSLNMLLVGVGLCIPVVLTYNAYAYYVFRGKVGIEAGGDGAERMAPG